MQSATPGRLFQRVKPLSFVSQTPIPRLCDSPVSFNVLRNVSELSQKNDAKQRLKDNLLAQVTPHPLMFSPGNVNPLGKYSPYIPPMNIPGTPWIYIQVLTRHF